VGKVAKPTLPVIAIPTTAGTGSEVTIFAVMSDPDNNEKFTISSPLIAPRVAILDGELTVKLPPMITACTSMDALTHAVEAYGSSITQPATDAYAIHAIKMIYANLPVAVHRGDNLAARGNMIQASLLAGIAFNNAFLGLAHAIASPLGGHFHVSHGMANAVMLPYVMAFNLPAAMEKYANIARALDLGTAGEPVRSLAEKAVAAVAELASDISIPLRLRDIGAKEDALPLVARDALKSIQLKFNPRLAGEQDILALLKKAY
jgi:alcohol dehydrogenase